MTEETGAGLQQPAVPSGTGNSATQPVKDSPKPRISEDTLNLFRIIICGGLLLPVVQLYFTIPSAISMWVADQYVPFVNMIYFALVIAGGIWLLRFTFRFSEEEHKRLQGQ